MFTRSREFIKSGNSSPGLFVESKGSNGDDLFNSELLRKLDKCTDRYEYKITKYENRIDLISMDIYGTDEYSWILLYINRVSVDDLKRELRLTYIDKSTLVNLIDSV